MSEFYGQDTAFLNGYNDAIKDARKKIVSLYNKSCEKQGNRPTILLNILGKHYEEIDNELSKLVDAL
jgi:hypothetical protein